jgi:hypothetical protein
LTGDRLLGQRLMAAFDDTMFSRWRLLDEADRHPQSDQPQMQQRRVRGNTDIIIEETFVNYAQ